MSIFGKIMSAIFGSKADAAPASGGAHRRLALPLGQPRIVAVVRAGSAGADRRCRADPRQGGRRQEARSWNGAPRSSI